MSSPELDVARIVATLDRHGADFVIIGGIAAVLHGSARNTFDLDVSFSTDPANLEALGAALTELHARLRGVEDDVPFVPDAATLKRVRVLTLSTDAGDLDVLVNPAGGPGFAALAEDAEVYEIDGVTFRIASLPHLIAMKRASGRPKDLLDLAELEAIERLRRTG